MRAPTAPRRRVLGSMTPMIDVVFLLIIFFLVSSHLARRQRRQPVDLPVASIADRVADDDDTFIVTIDAGGTVFVRGQPVSPTELAAILPPDLTRVRIRSDRELPYGTLAEIMAKMNAGPTTAGAQNVAIELGIDP